MLEEGEEVGVHFMDFKKAFDLVNHRLLFVDLGKTVLIGWGRSRGTEKSASELTARF